MFYHTKLTFWTDELRTEYLFDMKLSELKKIIALPFTNLNNLILNGVIVPFDKIERLEIIKSNKNKQQLVSEYSSKHKVTTHPNNSFQYSIIKTKSNVVTDKLLLTYTRKDIQKNVQNSRSKMKINNNKVFVVHGHDIVLKTEVQSFLFELGFEPIILHKQSDGGATIIEKFEKNSNVSFAIILLTPDDNVISNKKILLSEFDPSKLTLKRARQNVIFEFGYFVGKLGRNKVCCLYKNNTELPTDVDGIIYKDVTNGLDSQKLDIIKELKAAGLDPQI